MLRRGVLAVVRRSSAFPFPAQCRSITFSAKSFGPGSVQLSIEGHETAPEFFLIDGHIATICLARHRSGEILVLDGGSRPDFKRIQRFVEEELGADMDDVRLLVCTHSHPDHQMMAHNFRKLGIPVAAPPLITEWYSGWGRLQGFIDFMMQTLVAYIRGRGLTWPFGRQISAIDHPLSDGDTLPYFPEWRVLSYPGHTDHMVILYHQPTGVLYCADAMVMIRGKPMPPVPVDCTESFRWSTSRISSLPVSLLLLAHGGAVPITSKEHWKATLDTVLTKLGTSGNAAIFLMQHTLFGWNPGIRALRRASHGEPILPFSPSRAFESSTMHADETVTAEKHNVTMKAGREVVQIDPGMINPPPTVGRRVGMYLLLTSVISLMLALPCSAAWGAFIGVKKVAGVLAA